MRGEIVPFVYMFRVVGECIYKVGFSHSPDIRLANLESVEKCNLTTIFTRQTKWAQQIERLIHRSLTSQRLRGEWYTLSEIEVLALQTKVDMLILNRQESARKALLKEKY